MKLTKENDPCYKDIVEAGEAVKLVTFHINENQKAKENSIRLLEIEQALHGKVNKNKQKTKY